MLRNALLIAALTLVGCSGPAPSTSPSPTSTATPAASPTEVAQATGKPDKAAAAAALKALAKAIEGEDWAAAKKVLVLPEGVPDQALDEELGKMSERQEISAAGVTKLVEEGKFGPASEIFKEQAKGWAQRAKVPIDKCWAFSLDPAQSMLYWDGKAFKVMRFDDIGKLSGD